MSATSTFGVPAVPFPVHLGQIVPPPQWCSLAIPTQISKSHRLTSVRYRAMRDAQGGVCALCGLHDAVRHPYPGNYGNARPLFVDHDHMCCNNQKGRSCGRCIRGLLCHKCNNDLSWYEPWAALVEHTPSTLTFVVGHWLEQWQTYEWEGDRDWYPGHHWWYVAAWEYLRRTGCDPMLPERIEWARVDRDRKRAEWTAAGRGVPA